jgi:hypothetical protein
MTIICTVIALVTAPELLSGRWTAVIAGMRNI